MDQPKKRLNGFAVSWFFAPYLGSADLDFFKRIKDSNIHYDVVQMKRENGELDIFRHARLATFDRIEVANDYQSPRTRKTRDEFEATVIQVFLKRMANYDFIISHSNEAPSHAAAYKCKQLSPHLPWIAYFGDLIKANPYVPYLSDYPLNDEDCATEELTLRNADVIICNNEYQKQLMFRGNMSPYAHKAVVIPHCFDPAMYSESSTTRSDCFTFLHIGTLYHTKRTAAPLIKATERLLEIYPEYKGRFQVQFFGGPYYADTLEAFNQPSARNHVRLEGNVSYGESLTLMRQADVLVAIDGIFNQKDDNLEFSPFFPGKLTDYMGAEKPIMAITMMKGPTAELLQASGNLVADERVDRIAYVLKRYIDGAVAYSPRAFTRFHSRIVSQEMELAIRTATQKPHEIPHLTRDLSHLVERLTNETTGKSETMGVGNRPSLVLTTADDAPLRSLS